MKKLKNPIPKLSSRRAEALFDLSWPRPNRFRSRPSSRQTFSGTFSAYTKISWLILALGLGACSEDGIQNTQDTQDRQTAAPNLVFENLAISTNSILPETNFNFTGNVRNSGDAASQEVSYKYYRSTEEPIDGGPSNQEEGAVAMLAPIEPEGTISLPIREIQSPSEVVDIYFYGICLLDADGNPEKCFSGGMATKLTILSPADFAVTSPLSSLPESRYWWGTFTLSATVRNLSFSNAASSGNTLSFYQSTDANITSDDTLIGSSLNIGALTVNDGVDGSGSDEETLTSVEITAPTTTPGSPSYSTGGPLYYGACAAEVNGEADTTNNCSPPLSLTTFGEQKPTQSHINGMDKFTIPTTDYFEKVVKVNNADTVLIYLAIGLGTNGGFSDGTSITDYALGKMFDAGPSPNPNPKNIGGENWHILPQNSADNNSYAYVAVRNVNPRASLRLQVVDPNVRSSTDKHIALFRWVTTAPQKKNMYGMPVTDMNGNPVPAFEGYPSENDVITAFENCDFRSYVSGDRTTNLWHAHDGIIIFNTFRDIPIENSGSSAVFQFVEDRVFRFTMTEFTNSTNLSTVANLLTHLKEEQGSRTSYPKCQRLAFKVVGNAPSDAQVRAAIGSSFLNNTHYDDFVLSKDPRPVPP